VSGGCQISVPLNKHQKYLIYFQWWCDTVAELSMESCKFWRFLVRWAGKANIYVGLEGLC
jgi:hypothetical protein